MDSYKVSIIDDPQEEIVCFDFFESENLESAEQYAQEFLWDYISETGHRPSSFCFRYELEPV